MGDDVIVTSLQFSPNNCPYLSFYWTYKLHFGFNIQHKAHLMIRLKVTLIDTEDQSWMSKVTKMNNISQPITFKDIIAGTKVQYNKRYVMT